MKKDSFEKTKKALDKVTKLQGMAQTLDPADVSGGQERLRKITRRIKARNEALRTPPPTDEAT